ncbi:putative alcohol dehydrogenase [Mycobacterium ulcerans str. Harvey]|uniref:Alcohol dehydrogenase n=1 Tax=Mycobacterium ulcerans str. Harvey TaxID=1299332 RepID=A0ABP3AKY4_MYCUL|nr:putative alcohol dehydrogenase [Mycobacterium ulcerans str. Harvey]
MRRPESPSGSATGSTIWPSASGWCWCSCRAAATARPAATEGITPCAPGSATNAAGTLLGGGIRISRSGQPIYHHLGVSGFATHAVVNRASAVAVPDEVPPQVAALLGCAVLTGGGAVLNVGKPVAGQSVAVVGLGGSGWPRCSPP